MSREDVMGSAGQGRPDYVPDPQQVKECVDLLQKTRINMLIRHPFWGTLATRLKLVDATAWCSSFAVDGKHFFYNVDYIQSLDRDEVKFCFAHSILHMAYDHFLRRDTRDQKSWDAATDYAVDRDLKAEHIGSMPDGALYDRQYDGMSAEEIYKQIEDNGGADGLQTIDFHMDPSAGDGDQDGDQSVDGNGNASSKKAPNIPEGEQKQLRDEFRNAMLQAAQQAGQQHTPNAVRDIIREMTEPKMDWREYLENSIKASFKDDYSWTTPSRRGMGMDMILPGMTPGDTIDICIAIDTSGSMTTQMLEDLLGEVYGIMTQYSDFKVHLWTFDTSVHGYKKFTPENIEEIKSYKLLGGGGTEFMVNYDFMKEKEIEPETFLMFTDGMPWGSWGDHEYCDTIYLVHSDPGHRHKAPEENGITLWYEDCAAE